MTQFFGGVLAAALSLSLSADVVAKDRAIKPVLIVLTSHNQLGDTGRPTGFHLAELTHPLAVFEDSGIPVSIASIAGGAAPADAIKLDDPINARYWNSESFRSAIESTPKLADLDPTDYSGIYFAGGHGTMWDFPNNPDVQRLTRGIWELGGVVGAVCHGPAALVNVKLSTGEYLVAGQDVSAFTDEEERAVGADKIVPFLLASTLVKRGATHHPAANWESKVVTSGRLVTGQNPASATGVGEAFRDLVLATSTAK